MRGATEEEGFLIPRKNKEMARGFVVCYKYLMRNSYVKVAKLPVMILKQGKRYVAHSPALDLSTSGKSEREVKKRFEQIVGIFFDELVDAGTLNEVLTDLGWKREAKQFQPPRVVSQKSINIRVPAMA